MLLKIRAHRLFRAFGGTDILASWGIITSLSVMSSVILKSNIKLSCEAISIGVPATAGIVIEGAMLANDIQIDEGSLVGFT
jgi:hypothetical protein